MEDLCCVRSHPDDFALRQTKAGDLCILLEPDDVEETERLKLRLAELQAQFGGQPVSLVHLTCQRFAVPYAGSSEPQESLGRLIDEMQKSSRTRQPIPLNAVSLVPIHVPFEDQKVMKWCIAISDELRAYQEHLFACLKRSGMQPLYRSWFVPTLITALKDIPSLEEPSQTTLRQRFPYLLFSGRRALLSRIHAADDYEIIAAVEV